MNDFDRIKNERDRLLNFQLGFELLIRETEELIQKGTTGIDLKLLLRKLREIDPNNNNGKKVIDYKKTLESVQEDMERYIKNHKGTTNNHTRTKVQITDWWINHIDRKLGV